MKRKLIFWGSIIIGIIAMVLIYRSFDNILKPFIDAPLILLIPYICVVILIHTMHVWRWDVVLKALKHKVPFFKLFSYWIMGYGVNYITPTAHIGGEPLKAAMLKTHDVPYTKGISSLLINKSFELTFDALFGLMGLIILSISIALPQKLWYYVIILSALCIIGIMQLFFRVLKKENAFIIFYKKIKFLFRKGPKSKTLRLFEDKLFLTGQNIRLFFSEHKLCFRKSMFISMFMWILMFVEYKLLLLMLGFDANLYQLFIIISFVGLAYFLPVPAALGVLEASQISAFTILKLSSGLAIAVSIVIRAKDLTVTVIGLLLVFFKGIKKAELS